MLQIHIINSLFNLEAIKQLLLQTKRPQKYVKDPEEHFKLPNSKIQLKIYHAHNLPLIF